MEEVTVWIFRSEEKYELTISLQRWTLFQMMVNKIKSDLKFSYIASFDNCTVQMVSSNTVCMKSKWVSTPFQAKSSRTFQGFSRAPLWFIWIYLQPSKMFVLKAMFWAWIQHVYMRKRQTARAWKRVQTRHLVTFVHAHWAINALSMSGLHVFSRSRVSFKIHLSLFTTSLRLLFPSFIPRIWPFWALVIVKEQIDVSF